MTRQLNRIRSANVFRPQCEALEDRNLLASVTATLTATTLDIKGTNNNDVVRIVDGGNGQPAPGNPVPVIQVFANGALIASGPSANITTISFNMKDGNDRVFYQGPFILTPDGVAGILGSSQSRTITGNLGDGDDSFYENVAFGNVTSFTVNVSGKGGDDNLATDYAAASATPSTYSITLNGDNGQDIITAIDGTGVFSTLIGRTTNVTLNLNGGNDDDTIGVFGFLDLDGTFNLNASGAGGQDLIKTQITLDKSSGNNGAAPPVLNGTKGTLNVSVLGGNDDDGTKKDPNVLLIVNNSLTPGNTSTTVSFNGGAGKNFLRTTGSNVTISVTKANVVP